MIAELARLAEDQRREKQGRPHHHHGSNLNLLVATRHNSYHAMDELEGAPRR